MPRRKASLSDAERRAFAVIEADNTARRRAFARHILAIPSDQRDSDGRPYYDDRDRDWASSVLDETERALGVSR